MSETNPWAQIDALKKKLADEKAAAVKRLEDAGYQGNVNGRLKWDGTFWSFPGRLGKRLESRTLEGVVSMALAVAPVRRRP